MRLAAAILAVAAVVAVKVPVAAPAVAEDAKPVAVPQFAVDALWPKALPNNWIIGQVAGITVDRFDRIWVLHRPNSLTPRERAAEHNPPESKCCVAAPPVLVFDQSGNLVQVRGAAQGRAINGPKASMASTSMAMTSSGSPATARMMASFSSSPWTASSCCRSASAGTATTAIRRSGSALRPTSPSIPKPMRSMRLTAMPIAAIVVFDSETGAYKRHWGAYGNRPSDAKTPPYDPAKPPSAQFGNPVHCVRIDADGFVYVCDRTNDRVQIFRKDGTFVSEHFYERNTRATGSVYELAFSPDRQQKFIYMIDGANGEMRIVDHASKEVVGQFGRVGRQAGQFTALHNVTVDRQGNIYTAEVQYRRAHPAVPPHRPAGLTRGIDLQD